MMFYRKFVLITVINLVACFAIMYGQGYAAWLHRENGFKTYFFGYFFWLGIFVFVAPLLLNDRDRTRLFDDDHRWASLVLFLLNTFGPLLMISLASRCIPSL